MCAVFCLWLAVGWKGVARYRSGANFVMCASFGHVFIGVRATHFGAVGVWCHDCGGWFDGAIARGYQHVVLGLGRGLRF